MKATRLNANPSPAIACIFAISIALLSCGIAAAYFGLSLLDQRKPDYQIMRLYVVSRLTDAEIRAASSRAKVEFSQAQAELDAQWKKDDREIAENLAKCRTDAAFRERQGPGGCSVPLGYMMGLNLEPKTPTEDQFYDMLLMGRCNFVETIHQAKKAGCLPP